MLVLLPIEVWMAILDWLRKDRSKLAIKFSQLGDRTFSEFYQHWFHKYTKNVQLGKLLITSVNEFNNCGDIVIRAQLHSCWEVKKDGKMVEETEVMVPFAQVPLPENIRAIKEVEIRFLDSEVLNFLRKLLALFTMSKIDLNLMSTGEPEVAKILGHFMSLLNGVRINQIYFKRGTGHYSLLDLFPAQMSGVKILNFTDYHNEHLALQIAHWLSTKRADAEPRIVFSGSPVGCRQLFDIITKQFLAATLPVSFFICVYYYVRFEPINIIPESRVENGATGEQLIVRLKESQVRQKLQKVLIGRCPANTDGNSWLQKIEQKLGRIWDQAGPKLYLHKPQLGQMQTDEAEALANADNNDDADKPGPSKKRLT